MRVQQQLSRPQFGPGVTIQTKQEQIYQKLLEKERKKQQRNTQAGDDNDMHNDPQALRLKRYVDCWHVTRD
jgi:predicted ATPase